MIAEYDEAGDLLNEYVYAGPRRIARINPAGERVYFHADVVGTPLLTTESSGAVMWRGESLPFGGEVTSVGLEENYKFAGKELDGETGLFESGARFYDPGIGRFLSIDEVGGDPISPQSWNRYGYSLANPMRFVDPDGRQPRVAEIYYGTNDPNTRTFESNATGLAMGGTALLVLASFYSLPVSLPVVVAVAALDLTVGFDGQLAERLPPPMANNPALLQENINVLKERISSHEARLREIDTEFERHREIAAGISQGGNEERIALEKQRRFLFQGIGAYPLQPEVVEGLERERARLLQGLERLRTVRGNLRASQERELSRSGLLDRN
ncbi:MAG: RHS repeat-associated core domain-containing protein [Acidobacteriota bacterium]